MATLNDIIDSEFGCLPIQTIDMNENTKMYRFIRQKFKSES